MEIDHIVAIHRAQKSWYWRKLFLDLEDGVNNDKKPYPFLSPLQPAQRQPGRCLDSPGVHRPIFYASRAMGLLWLPLHMQ